MGIFSQTSIETISILGCGWLGYPLAKYLIKQGYKVKGSTTSAEKVEKFEKAGIKPYVIRLLPAPEGRYVEEFFEADLLIIAIPPKIRGGMSESFHPTQIQHVLEYVEKSESLNRVIYISSTSVYPNSRKQVMEKDAVEYDEVSRALLTAERLLQQNASFDCTILRCGGLMGYDRIPGKYFAGKTGLQTAYIPVNYIHRDDVILIIAEVIRQGRWETAYNLVAPIHPQRKEVYDQNAKDFGFEPPQFDEDSPYTFKIVSSYKLISDLGYRFKYANPMDFYYRYHNAALEEEESDDYPTETPDLY